MLTAPQGLAAHKECLGQKKVNQQCLKDRR
jgi:hypothetical protein